MLLEMILNWCKERGCIARCIVYVVFYLWYSFKRLESQRWKFLSISFVSPSSSISDPRDLPVDDIFSLFRARINQHPYVIHWDDV